MPPSKKLCNKCATAGLTDCEHCLCEACAWCSEIVARPGSDGVCGGKRAKGWLAASTARAGATARASATWSATRGARGRGVRRAAGAAEVGAALRFVGGAAAGWASLVSNDGQLEPAHGRHLLQQRIAALEQQRRGSRCWRPIVTAGDGNLHDCVAALRGGIDTLSADIAKYSKHLRVLAVHEYQTTLAPAAGRKREREVLSLEVLEAEVQRKRERPARARRGRRRRRARGRRLRRCRRRSRRVRGGLPAGHRPARARRRRARRRRVGRRRPGGFAPFCPPATAAPAAAALAAVAAPAAAGFPPAARASAARAGSDGGAASSRDQPGRRRGPGGGDGSSPAAAAHGARAAAAPAGRAYDPWTGMPCYVPVPTSAPSVEPAAHADSSTKPRPTGRRCGDAAAAAAAAEAQRTPARTRRSSLARPAHA